MGTKIDKNPYGKPGRGNYDKAWQRLNCQCGKHHSLEVSDNKATVTHKPA